MHATTTRHCPNNDFFAIQGSVNNNVTTAQWLGCSRQHGNHQGSRCLLPPFYQQSGAVENMGNGFPWLLYRVFSYVTGVIVCQWIVCKRCRNPMWSWVCIEVHGLRLSHCTTFLLLLERDPQCRHQGFRFFSCTTSIRANVHDDDTDPIVPMLTPPIVYSEQAGATLGPLPIQCSPGSGYRGPLDYC